MVRPFITRQLLMLFYLIIGWANLQPVAASNMVPRLDKIFVLEYYKYEQGGFKNYALVSNPLDTDITLVIVKARGFYERPYKYVTDSQLIQSGAGKKYRRYAHLVYLPLSGEDSLKLGTPRILPGDTLVSGIRLKARETKIIPNLFEQLRLPTAGQRAGLKSSAVSSVVVMVNGVYAGGYNINLTNPPPGLPHSGYAFCTSYNAGSIMPFWVHIDDNSPENGLLIVQLFDVSTNPADSVQINPVQVAGYGAVTTGLPVLQPQQIDVAAPAATVGNPSLSEAQPVRFSDDYDYINMQIQLPAGTHPALTGFNIRLYHYNPAEPRETRSGQYLVWLPVNIQL